jgi:hypothetical protein
MGRQSTRIYPHTFTWGGLVAEAQAPPLGDPKDAASTQEGSSFSSCKDYTTALNLLLGGWPDGVRRLAPLQHKISGNVGQHIRRVEWPHTYDQPGILDMGAYLAGDPECWQVPTPTIVEASGGLVHILVNASYDCGRNEEQVWAHGAAVATLCETLEQSGRSVRLTLGYLVRSYRDNVRYESNTYVRLKDFGEPLNMGRLVFALAHPAMLRRIIFRVFERYTREERDAMGFHANEGYGSPGWFGSDAAGAGTKDAPNADIVIDQMVHGTPTEIENWVLERLREQGVSLHERGDGPR